MADQKGRSPKVDRTAARIAAHGRPVVEITGWVSEVSEANVRVHTSRDGRRSIDVPRDAIVEIVDGPQGEASRIFVSGEAQLRLTSIESTMVPASVALGGVATWRPPAGRLGRQGGTIAKPPGSPVIPPDPYELCLQRCEDRYLACLEQGTWGPYQGEWCYQLRASCREMCYFMYVSQWGGSWGW
jgi:hypothetical protein